MTKIEWTRSDDGAPGRSWNPVVGCSIVSPGCTNCYAMRMAARIEAIDRVNQHAPHYRGLTKRVKGKPVWTGKVGAAPDNVLRAPLSWQKPCRCFVNSMSDLFHEGLSDEVIDKVVAVMMLVPHVTFIVVTKRAARMRDYFRQMERAAYDDNGIEFSRRWGSAAAAVTGSPCASGAVEEVAFPIPNLWLLVSAEDQPRADERIPFVLDTPAAIRGVSLEPMIGEIELRTQWLYRAAGGVAQNVLDWVITGGEDGDRPAPLEWFVRVQQQCSRAGVAYFHKQNGVFVPVIFKDDAWRTLDGAPTNKPRVQVGNDVFVRVAKRAAGAKFWGREWREFPK